MSDQQQQTGGTNVWQMIKWGIYALLAIWLISSFFKKDRSNVSYETVEVLEPTEGVITTVDEVEADLFKISDEEVVPLKEDSRIIANYLDGASDTFTLAEARLIDTTITDRSNPRYRHSMIRSVIWGGAMGYMMGRSMRSPLMRGSYRSDAAYNRASTSRTRMSSTASRRTVTKPSRSNRTGYGKSRSTRSYGG